MSQISENRELQKQQPKPPRLRSACNQCNAAKVKCSGEREGCTRCKAIQSYCIYTESRVGKVQGARSKRRKPDSNPGVSAVTSVDGDSIDVIVANPTKVQTQRSDVANSPDQSLQSWSESWVTPGAWAYDVPTLEGSLSNFDDMLEGSTVNWSVDAIGGTGEATNDSSRQIDNMGTTTARNLNFSTEAPSSNSGSSTSSRGSVRLQSVGNIHSISSPASGTLDPGRLFPTPNSSRVTTPPTCKKRQREPEPQPELEPEPDQEPSPGPEQELEPEQEPEPEPEVPEQNFAKLDSRCVLACAHILATLENYLLSELRALDLVLEAIRKATNELKQLVQLQQESRCDRCIIIFTAIMFQIIELLEAGATPAPDEEGDSMGGLMSSMHTNFVPAFGLGSFSLSDEERRSWRWRIVRKEYRHVSEVLSGVMVLAKLGPRGASLAPDMVDQRTKCLQNLERKLKSLCERDCGGDL